MAQNPAEWLPSPKQALVLKAALEAGLNRNISAICKAAKVNRDSFYDWMTRDPDFKLAWENLYRRALAYHLPGVFAAMLQKAHEGDVPAGRLLLEAAGLIKQKLEHSGPGGAPIDVAGQLKVNHEVSPQSIASVLAILRGAGVAPVDARGPGPVPGETPAGEVCAAPAAPEATGLPVPPTP